MRVLAAPDKFRGSATAPQIAAAVTAGAKAYGATCFELPLADGGEGMLDAFGGANRESQVTGPLGDPVVAGWRLDGKTAVIEMAKAAGLELVCGAEGNDPVGASTSGVGELIDQAVQRGARKVIVGLGGSATTDGGLGALRAMHPVGRLRGVEVVVACDVETLFVQAAEVFAPQKGATDAQVQLLERRLERLAQVYQDDFGVDVTHVSGSGAAGGLAGALLAVGATLVPGFEVVAEEVGLFEAIESCDVVVTGEGLLDEQSFKGKVVGGVVELAAEAGVPVLVVCGESEVAAPGGVEVVSLVEQFGEDRSFGETASCVTEVVERWLADSVG